jgi:hypothetical protein
MQYLTWYYTTIGGFSCPFPNLQVVKLLCKAGTNCIRTLAQHARQNTKQKHAANSTAQFKGRSREISLRVCTTFLTFLSEDRRTVNLTCWPDCWNQDPRTLGWWRNYWDDCDRFRSWKFEKLVRDFRKKAQFAERKVGVRMCCSCLEMLRLFHPQKMKYIERVKKRVLTLLVYTSCIQVVHLGGMSPPVR